MSADTRANKISTAVAEGEAGMLLEKISRCPESAAALSRELNRQYTSGPRKTILIELRKRLARQRLASEPLVHEQSGVPFRAVHDFLGSQLEGVPERSFDDHFREILAVMSEFPEEQGVPIATALTHKVISDPGHTSLDMTRVTGAASILSNVLEQICTDNTPDRKQLQRWIAAAQPMMNLAQRNSRIRPFSPDEATRILNILVGIDHNLLPYGLQACIPGLIVLAGPRGAAGFLQTPAGQPFAMALSDPGWSNARDEGMRSPGEDRKDEPADIPTQVQLSRLLEQVERLFGGMTAQTEQMEQRFTQQVREVELRLEQAKEKLVERAQELYAARAAHRKETDEYQVRIHGLEQEKQQLATSNERLRADIRLMDENARRNITEKEDERRRQLSQLLAPAMGSLRRDLEQTLRKYPGNEDIRNIGIAFDQLHRILRREVSNLDDTRLPGELLDPSSQR